MIKEMVTLFDQNIVATISVISCFFNIFPQNLGHRCKDLILMHLRIDKQATLLAVFLVFAASASGQTERNYKFHEDGNLQEINMLSSDHSIIINYTVPEIQVKGITTVNGPFYRLYIHGHIAASDPGKPELPVYSRLISIPEGSDFRIKITDVRSKRISPAGRVIKGLLFPVQESETKQVQRTRPAFRYDKKIYSSRSFISSDTVRIVPLGRVRKNELANLYITPVRYNPHSNEIEVITSMRIEITFSDKEYNITKSVQSERALFNQSLDKAVLNFNPEQVLPGYTDKPVKMIIVTDPSFKKQLEPFFRWKTQKGFRLNILYKGTSLGNYSLIKDSLTKIYKSSSVNDPPPEYILIIGDANIIPYFGSGGTGNVTDMYYGEFDGHGDYIPEMFIGRIPVADTNELKVAINKIIQYEKFQFADTNKFYSRSVASAGYDQGYSSYMNGQLKYATTNYLTIVNGINESHFNYPESLTAKDSLMKLIKKGISFINYTGHGDASGWLHIDIKSADIPVFDNKNMYPFVISNACRTAQYSIANSMGNRMLLTADKGAIGFIGCSNDSYWDEDYYWAVGPCIISAEPTYKNTGLGAYDRLFHTHNENPSDWYFTMGQINFAGNLAVSASTSPRKQYYWETYNLIGDPSVIPIMGKPGNFSVSLPDTIPNGIRSLSLITDPFAYIAVSHFDTLWDASYATGSGGVTLDLPEMSDDSCLVMITGQNKFPVIKTIHISSINKEFVNLTSIQLNDNEGNNDGRADYGESIRLKIKLSNLGQTDAHNLHIRIVSDSNLLTITGDSAFIGDIPAGSEFMCDDKLTFTVLENISDLGTAAIKLYIRDQLIEKQYSYDVCIHAPVLQIVNYVIDDKIEGNGNNIADPGETFRLVFKIRNGGSSSIEGQFNITGSPGITIIDPSVKSGNLKFGQDSEIPVLVKLSDKLLTGSVVSIASNLICSSFIVNKDFSFRVGKIRESFEALSFNIFPWINTSPVPWIISPATSYDGYLSARSGIISDNSKTTLVLKTLYSNPDTIRFHYRTSSEQTYDFLSFRLNGSEILKKSGEVQWTKASFPVPKGLNVMEWSYTKDNSVSQGSDCAWIDMIDFSQSAQVSYIQKDIMVARIITPVQKNRFGQGIVSVKILNSGKDTIYGFNLAYKVNEHSSVEQYFNSTLNPSSDSVQVSFSEKADLSKSGNYDLVAYAFGNKDEYSGNDTVMISFKNEELTDSLLVYPNPFDNRFTIFVNSRIADNLQILITNLAGGTIYSTTKNVIPGKNTIIVNDFTAAPSIYFLKIHGQISDHTFRLIKLNR